MPYSHDTSDSDLAFSLRVVVFVYFYVNKWTSLVAQMVKNQPAMQETRVWLLGWEDPLETGMATHYSIRAWRIARFLPGDGQKSLEVYSPRGHKEPDMAEQLTLLLSRY